METYESSSQQFEYTSTISYQYVDRVEEKPCRRHESDHERIHILKGLLKEIDHKGHKMCKQLIEEDAPIGRVVRKTVHDLCGNSGLDMLEKIVRKLNEEEDGHDHIIRSDRDVDGDILQEIKVDRFKVKTMNTIGAGVVKEE